MAGPARLVIVLVLLDERLQPCVVHGVLHLDVVADLGGLWRRQLWRESGTCWPVKEVSRVARWGVTTVCTFEAGGGNLYANFWHPWISALCVVLQRVFILFFVPAFVSATTVPEWVTMVAQQTKLQNTKSAIHQMREGKMSKQTCKTNKPLT